MLTTGGHDPWHPDALRGAAGLHYAVPVARLTGMELRELDRPLLAIDPEGEPFEPSELPARAVLAFGSERQGLTRELIAVADARVSIPMRAGVSRPESRHLRRRRPVRLAPVRTPALAARLSPATIGGRFDRGKRYPRRSAPARGCAEPNAV